MNKFVEQLIEMRACEPAIDWIEERCIDSVEEFWKVSDRSDWMLWLVYRRYPGIHIDTRILRELALAFAQMVVPYAGRNKQLCIDCIYAAYQYLDGWIDADELKRYQKNVYTARAAYVARATDADTAAAVAVAADSSADAYAAYAADSSAYAYADAYAARTAALKKMRKFQADLIRQYVLEV